ncbi:hypothetical protein CA85_14880 [Allorhodopirellula solitaria]|uniref:Uncharacterized protein n=1 Tax=Allorhodopirellula solitaria TaxID=2527987 RepID=A0A5C5YBE7_9BACT|nr:hypothetical protein CA85_14880 [Allorhodopirellula solitaria]
MERNAAKPSKTAGNPKGRTVRGNVAKDSPSMLRMPLLETPFARQLQDNALAFTHLIGRILIG